MRGTIQERFEAKFTKSDGCWEWDAGKGGHGYGQFKIAGHMKLAHRVAYELYVGEIPEGMCVCHRCDNPSCVNPKHLFLGTYADNVHDCENKGRGVHLSISGERCGRSKLTEEQVKTIRKKINEGATQSAVAREFGVVPGTISFIICGHSWTHI